MLPTKTADVVIIGGGVMGASAAYHLARQGVQKIVLLERESFFGTGATGRCAGGVRHQFGTEINVRLSIESLAMLERFKDEIGQDINYRKCGYLFVLTDEPHVRVFRQNADMQRRLGAHTQWLSGDEVRRRLPLMSFEDALGGTFNQDDGLVDPNSVVSGYISAAQRLGVHCLADAPVTGVQAHKGKIEGVATPLGTIQADVVLNAAGPWAAEVGGLAGVELPITPVRRQWFTTTPLPELPADFPFVIDFAQSLYFHTEGEGLLIGMSNPQEAPGYDQRVDEDFELLNAEAAILRMPILERAGRASHAAGLYEVTPDAHPIFGPTPVDGFYVVAGFSGHGFMHGPIAGKLIAELIVEKQYRTLDVSMLDLARFAEHRLIQEYNVV
ncbi:MAG TPA: FAD-dependent oxidoreductase [Anaerolineales bacterium]|nr:FAD-dependent oxidoreductase [Anaerolineales bacterium]